MIVETKLSDKELKWELQGIRLKEINNTQIPRRCCRIITMALRSFLVYSEKIEKKRFGNAKKIRKNYEIKEKINCFDRHF